MRRGTVAHTVKSALWHLVGTVILMGLVDKVWAYDALSAHKRSYAGAAASTHARFGKRNKLMYNLGYCVVIGIEVYGVFKGLFQLIGGFVYCSEQTIALCQAPACFKSVCAGHADYDPLHDGVDYNGR
jgi:hypothetical protein